MLNVTINKGINRVIALLDSRDIYYSINTGEMGVLGSTVILTFTIPDNDPHGIINKIGEMKGTVEGTISVEHPQHTVGDYNYNTLVNEKEEEKVCFTAAIPGIFNITKL